MKKSLMLTLLIIAASMLAACSSGASSSVVGDWKLISYGSASSPTPALPDTETSLVFDSEGKVGGTVGCNSFGGDYTVEGETITFSAINSTLMACADPIMQQESTVFITFSNPATFVIEGNTLTVTAADGQTTVVLERK